MIVRVRGKIIALFLLAGIHGVLACSTNTPGFSTAQIWVTSGDQSSLLREQPSVSGTRKNNELNSIQIDEKTRFQTMDGFGASFTESSGYAISALSKADADALMVRFFDREKGIGISFLRQPMGSPDFALSPYSYDDLEEGKTDFDLALFSIERDRALILPYLKQALSINPDLKIMATPWSPPAWMKTGRSLMGAPGGSLRKECYEVYAQYFVRFIRAYEAEGIPIFAVTPQNEINFAPPLYSGMKMSSAEEAEFIGKHLGPAFEREGIKTKILCYDHNWDRADIAAGTLSDPAAAKYLSGSAWHYYGGEARAMSDIHAKFPDKDIWFTEGGSGRWIGKGTFLGTFKDGISQGIEICRNWSKSIIWWNIALDQNNGPIVFTNTANYGLVEIIVDPESGTGSLSQTERSSLYTLAHFSKFIHSGAIRVDSSSRGLDLANVAFENPDGGIVLVVFNRYSYPVKVSLQLQGRFYPVELPENSAATVVF
jgi:glucosylceramidase